MKKLTALATAFLIQVRFFYEVPEANKFERICAFLVLVLMVAGLWFATVVTLNIMAGIFFGIVIPAMIRRVFKLLPGSFSRVKLGMQCSVLNR